MRVLIALSAIIIATGANAQTIALPDAERIVLENGAVLILHEKHDVPLVGMQINIRGGAVADPSGKYGLANLLAGLMEKGAGNRSSREFVEATASVGGVISASAQLESVNISADFLSSDIALMVELVSDMLQRPTLSKVEFTKLRERSVNLIKAAKGSNPNTLIRSYANAFLFSEHPYGNPLGGAESSLQNIRHEDLLAYFENEVGADRLVIAVSGDFSIAQMRTLLSDAFSDWRPAAKTLDAIEVPMVPLGRRVYLVDKPGATQSYFTIGNTAVSRSYSGRGSLDLANTVFGGRFTSMLMTELRTKSGLSYSANSTLAHYANSGSVFISSFTQTSKTLEAINVALNTLGQLHEQGLDENMIESAHNYVMGRYPTRLETAQQLAVAFAQLEMQHLDSTYVFEYGKQLAAATPATVAAAIEDVYPSLDNLVFIVIGDADAIRDQLGDFGEITPVSISDPRFHP